MAASVNILVMVEAWGWLEKGGRDSGSVPLDLMLFAEVEPRLCGVSDCGGGSGRAMLAVRLGRWLGGWLLNSKLPAL